MTRKAVIVGINDYSFGRLKGCILDADKMQAVLSEDFDETPNFTCRKLVSSNIAVTIPVLKQAVIDLFKDECDVALFYFSGHGTESTDTSTACLVTQDAQNHNEGMELSFLIDRANRSKAREVVIILDCCYSGAAGNTNFLENISILREGISVITSSGSSQLSVDTPDGGVFTAMIYNALIGGAADILGLVTVADVYSYADKLLDPFQQRPVFKSYVSKMISLRKCQPIIPLSILRNLPKYFNESDQHFQLDPSFEPDLEPKGHPNEKIFEDLQRYERASLLVPIEAKFMYYAAKNSKSCALTPLGKYYWKLAKDRLI